MDKDKIHKETRFRYDTKNLIVSGIKDELTALAEKFQNAPFTVKQLSGPLQYKDISQFTQLDTTGGYIYLALTKDRSGKELHNYAQARTWFADFDTVIAITQASRLGVGITEIKAYGEYVGAYREHS